VHRVRWVRRVHRVRRLRVHYLMQQVVHWVLEQHARSVRQVRAQAFQARWLPVPAA
jgi:hypothetical protein